KQKSVFLAVIVCAAAENFRQRITIRKTWGSVAKTNKEIALVFMLGKTSDSNVQQEILNESNLYHDIIQEDFVDSYRNLTYKSVAMLKWSYTYCPSAQYVLKADDDMFVNLEYLLNVLKHKRLKETVIGLKVTGARPNQDKSSKWYAPKELFNGTVYPPYCSGTSYVISGDSVKKLYSASLDTPYFYIEDVFITGICRTRANIKISNDQGFIGHKPTASGCFF
ncbi:beta-1,3-galactosyltransferase 1-like, partial [Mytilus galloprovincialis]|uniref:beta-1,3-galactosyltransferase 1-like n=1 Tax=Mytilus galloprovincialis TaxID=29158 RepID=UPI003F7BB2D2